MDEEIPVVDQGRKKSVIAVSASSSAIKQSNNQTLDMPADKELSTLLQGDVTEGVILKDLQTANTIAQNSSGDQAKPLDFTAMAKDVSKGVGLNLSNSIILRRLSIVLKSYINGVRKLHEVRDFIAKGQEKGGLGLSMQIANKAADIIEKLQPDKYVLEHPAEIVSPTSSIFRKPLGREDINKDNKKEISKDKPSGGEKGLINKIFPISTADNQPTKTDKPDDKQLPKDEKKPKQAKDKIKSTSAGEEMEQQIKSINKQTKAKITGQAHLETEGTFQPPLSEPRSDVPIKKEKHESLKVKAALSPMSLPSPKQRDVSLEKVERAKSELTSSRKAVADMEVKDKSDLRPIVATDIAPRLVGPIDELRFGLDDFRRLAPEPEDRIKKIEAKVDLLEEESFLNKYLGIASWMQSEVVRKYIALGERSLRERKSVDLVILENTATEGNQAMNKEGFNAVAKVNALLRI